VVNIVGIGKGAVKYVLEIYVVVHVACCCHSVQYVFNVECNGVLNISIDDHILVGMKQTVLTCQFISHLICNGSRYWQICLSQG